MRKVHRLMSLRRGEQNPRKMRTFGELVKRIGRGIAPPFVLSAVAEIVGFGVTQLAQCDNELTGCLGAKAVGALAQDALLSPMMGHGDLILSDRQESKAREALTDGSEGEG